MFKALSGDFLYKEVARAFISPGSRTWTHDINDSWPTFGHLHPSPKHLSDYNKAASDLRHQPRRLRTQAEKQDLPRSLSETDAMDLAPAYGGARTTLARNAGPGGGVGHLRHLR